MTHLLLAFVFLAVSHTDSLIQRNACYLPGVIGRCTEPSWTRPLSPRRIVATFYDPTYLNDPQAAPRRQHLGLDMTADSGSAVYSPVTGRITEIVRSTDPGAKVVIIQESGTGVYHVLGHVDTTYAVGRSVVQGEQVARVANWGSRSHVHWGAYYTSSARGVTRDGEWGWGRGPERSARSQAIERGFIDLARYASR